MESTQKKQKRTHTEFAFRKNENKRGLFYLIFI